MQLISNWYTPGKIPYLQIDFLFCYEIRFLFSILTGTKKIKMKKIICLTAIAAIVFASCESKKEATTAAEAPKGSGYTLDSSANIDLAKKINYAFPAGDSVTAFACYNDTAKVHDNLHIMTVKENFREFQGLVKQGLTFKVDKFNAIFEVVNNKPSPNGISNYVVAWVTLNLQKGAKSIKVQMNQAFAMKDGKIVEEWDTYDSAGLMDLMK